MITRAQLIIVWSVALLALFVLVNPHYDAQWQNGDAWVDSPFGQSAWIWSPPDFGAAFRVRADHGRQVIYLAALLILGSAAFFTAPRLSPPSTRQRTQRLTKIVERPATGHCLKDHPIWCQLLLVASLCVAALVTAVRGMHMGAAELIGYFIGTNLMILGFPAILTMIPYRISLAMKRRMKTEELMALDSAIAGVVVMMLLVCTFNR